MKVFLIVFLLQCLYVKQSVQTPTELPKVSIYYESLCPFSTGFFTSQFYPAYKKIGSSLKINFVPYGNAEHKKVDDKWQFTCQHGEEECWGNKAQACGLAQDKDQDKKVDFVTCMMGNDNPASEAAVNECSPKLEVAAELIFECMKSGQGDDLLAALGNETNSLRPKLSGVPSVIFNDVYDEYVDYETESNFLGVACRFLPSKPDGCPVDDNKLVEETQA